MSQQQYNVAATVLPLQSATHHHVATYTLCDTYILASYRLANPKLPNMALSHVVTFRQFW